MKTVLPTGMYYKETKCPVCECKFKTIKVKSNASIVDRKDEDFCPYYKELNPLYYEIIVCPECAYAASETTFNEIPEYGLIMLRNAFKTRRVARNYCEIREWSDALDSFKLALLTATTRKAKANVIAGICLRIAWIYREKNDEKEKDFLKYSYENYRKTFEDEEPPYGNLSEIMLSYILGELARRIDLTEDAKYWLGKTIQSPQRKDNPRVEEMARNQLLLVKEDLKASK